MERIEPGVDPPCQRQSETALDRSPVGACRDRVERVAETRPGVRGISRKQAVEPRRSGAHLAHHHDRRRDRRGRKVGLLAPQPTQCVTLADCRGQLAIGHGVAQRVERGLLGQARAQALEPAAEIGDILRAADRDFVCRFEALAALAPQEFGIERRSDRQPVLPHPRDDAVGVVRETGAGKRMRAIRGGHC